MIKIEGRVDVDLDESSESEAEDEPAPAVAAREQPIEVTFGNDDDEEEEVEYFGGKDKPAKQSEPKLASILSAQVKEAEGNTVPKGTVPATDEFGITYQSKKKVYNTSTSEPVLVVVEGFDEEIALRLLKADLNKPAEDDDEFDLDIADDNNGQSNAETIKKALENAAAVAANAEATLIAKAATPSSIETSPQVGEVPVTVASIMEEAKKALAEVAEVYGSGLGDHEVHLMSSSTAEKASASSNTVQQSAKLGCVEAIEEGDEEAAELEEEQEEERAVETVRAAEQATTQLESEWDNLDSAPTAPTKATSAQGSSSSDASTSAALAPIEKWRYTKALQLFKGLDHSAYTGSIVVREETKGGWFSAAPKPLSYTGCKEDLDLPFLIAQVDYNPESVAHYGMLSTIYSALVDSSATASKKWEKLGFQGNDPRTDLNRSMKMLSVVQMLSYIEHDPSVARRVFELSQSAQEPAGAAAQSIAERNARSAQDTSWPFMCVAIMFTKEALQCLRRGVLNDKCNKRKTVFGVINEFHRACFAEFESLLRAQPTVHHAVHLAALRKLCDANPLKLMKKWKEAARTAATAPVRTLQPAGSTGATGATDSEFRFDNLESVQEKAEDEGNGSSWSSVFTDRKAAKFAAV